MLTNEYRLPQSAENAFFSDSSLAYYWGDKESQLVRLTPGLPDEILDSAPTMQELLAKRRRIHDSLKRDGMNTACQQQEKSRPWVLYHARTHTYAHSSEIEHSFQSKSNTRSNPFRTVIPIESEHRFQVKSNAFRVGLGVAKSCLSLTGRGYRFCLVDSLDFS